MPVNGQPISTIQVKFVKTVTCSDAIITPSYLKRDWVLDADPDKEFLIDWKYFLISAGISDAVY